MAHRPNEFDPDELERQLDRLGRLGCDIGRQMGREFGKGLKKGLDKMEQSMRQRPIDVPASEVRPVRRAAPTPPARPARDPRAYLRMRLRTGRVWRMLGGWAAALGALAVGFQSALLLDQSSFITGILLVVCAAALLVAAVRLFRAAALCRRAVTYLDALAQRQSCPLHELAGAAGCSLRRVRVDLRVLARGRQLGQMYLSDDRSQIFFSEEAYKKYQEEQKKASVLPPVEPPADGAQSEMLDAAAQQCAQLQQLLPLLDDEQVRSQTERLHTLAEKILDQVRRHPEKQDDVRKFCRYYLPTTIKLLRTYAQLDDDPVEGIHTDTIRSDIPGILHTLEKAFSSLLDSLYADVAMDVSSDIRVLRSMLEQEGLADSENKL